MQLAPARFKPRSIAALQLCFGTGVGGPSGLLRAGVSDSDWGIIPCCAIVPKGGRASAPARSVRRASFTREPPRRVPRHLPISHVHPPRSGAEFRTVGNIASYAAFMIRSPVIPPGSALGPRFLAEHTPARNGAAQAGRLSREGSTRTHVLTIALEDYFHVTPLQSVVHQDRWYRFEMRLEDSEVPSAEGGQQAIGVADRRARRGITRLGERGGVHDGGLPETWTGEKRGTAALVASPRRDSAP